MSRLKTRNSSSWRMNTGKLILRIVAGLLFISLGIMQTALPLFALGLPHFSHVSGIAVIVLASMAMLGLGGRLPALGLVASAVMALASTSAAAPTDLNHTLQLHLTYIYGAIAAIMVIFGSGQFTLVHFLRTLFRP